MNVNEKHSVSVSLSVYVSVWVWLYLWICLCTKYIENLNNVTETLTTCDSFPAPFWPQFPYTVSFFMVAWLPGWWRGIGLLTETCDPPHLGFRILSSCSWLPGYLVGERRIGAVCQQQLHNVGGIGCARGVQRRRANLRNSLNQRSSNGQSRSGSGPPHGPILGGLREDSNLHCVI